MLHEEVMLSQKMLLRNYALISDTTCQLYLEFDKAIFIFQD